MDYKDVERILASAYTFYNKIFGINRDYPPEIVSARSNMWTDYKLEKSRHRDGTFYIVFTAKLVVDLKVIRDEFPDWKEVLKGSRTGMRKLDTQSVNSSTRDGQGQMLMTTSTCAIPK